METHLKIARVIFIVFPLVVSTRLVQPCLADVNVGFNTGTPLGGAKGIFLDRPANEPYAAGITWMAQESPCWEVGLDTTLDYPGVPDLVLAENPSTRSDMFRLRADTGQVVMGSRVGHPPDNFAQFLVSAGSASQPLGGMAIGTFGYQFGIYLFNQNAWEKRTTFSLQNLFLYQTDTQENGTGDYQFYNVQASTPVYTVQPDNSFRLVAAKEGFFGSPPVTQPTVTGSWSDGSAAKSLLAALVSLGLAKDNTTP